MARTWLKYSALVHETRESAVDELKEAWRRPRQIGAGVRVALRLILLGGFHCRLFNKLEA